MLKANKMFWTIFECSENFHMNFLYYFNLKCYSYNQLNRTVWNYCSIPSKSNATRPVQKPLRSSTNLKRTVADMAFSAEIQLVCMLVCPTGAGHLASFWRTSMLENQQPTNSWSALSARGFDRRWQFFSSNLLGWM